MGRISKKKHTQSSESAVKGKLLKQRAENNVLW